MLLSNQGACSTFHWSDVWSTFRNKSHFYNAQPSQARKTVFCRPKKHLLQLAEDDHGLGCWLLEPAD